jgi:uncharacterized protein (DUF362 family)/Pyruvate/2-oxoacid:ferredoxin oxidoreductase delta subunit
MPRISIILLDDYRPDDLAAGFEAAFAELGPEVIFKPGEKIVIKPNLFAAISPELAATPHPEVFRALALQLRQMGVKVSYGDSPAVDTPERAARGTGFAAIAQELDIPLADFNDKVDRHLPKGKVLKYLPLAKGVADSDGLVSFAKLKTHALTGLTCTIKNLFGVIPGARKAVYHSNYQDPAMFCQMLVDIAAAVRPRLSVLDAVVAMEGNGPRSGTPRKVGAILISSDPVAVDAAAAFLVGQDPRSILTTRLAAEAGLGEMNLKRVAVSVIRPNAGPPSASGQQEAVISRGTADQLLDKLRVMDFKAAVHWQTFLTLLAIIGKPIMKRFILNRPVIDKNICIHCGACASCCPIEPKAVSQTHEEALPVYDYYQCIRCYCCQEICPAGAIAVRRSLIGKILNT